MKYLIYTLYLLFIAVNATLFAQPLEFTMKVYDKQKTKGYYFLCTYFMHKEAGKNTQQTILDGNGHVVYYRNGVTGSDFKLQPDGRMTWFSYTSHMIMDSTFTITDSVYCKNGKKTDSHDFLILPNGHFLLLGLDSTKGDLSKIKRFMGKGLAGSKKATVLYGVVQELDAEKNVVYEWRSQPYFSPHDVATVYLKDTALLDVTHFNSVEPDNDGNWIISVRYSNEIIKVNKQTGTVLWRLGGPHNQFTFINDTLRFLGQHDARLTPAGNLTLFDNGYTIESERHAARGIEYRLDEQKLTATLVWSYRYKEYLVSDATGNMHRSKNGMTLINFGRVAFAKPNVTCVLTDENAVPVMELSFKDTIGSYRCFYYPQLPFTLPQPRIQKVYHNGQTFLQTEGDFSAYQWSTGETSRKIKINQPGTYYVYVPVPSGGWLSSEVTVVKETDVLFK